jgi:hypothetical protein
MKIGDIVEYLGYNFIVKDILIYSEKSHPYISLGHLQNIKYPRKILQQSVVPIAKCLLNCTENKNESGN